LIFSKNSDSGGWPLFTMDFRIEADSWKYLLFRPRAVLIHWDSSHKLEIKAATAYQSVYRDILAKLLDGWKILIDHRGDSLQALRGSLVTLVLASPLSTYTVERHGTVSERNIVQGSDMTRRSECARRKGLNMELEIELQTPSSFQVCLYFDTTNELTAAETSKVVKKESFIVVVGRGYASDVST